MSRNDSELGNFKTGVADLRAEPKDPRHARFSRGGVGACCIRAEESPFGKKILKRFVATGDPKNVKTLPGTPLHTH
jgi:hypothetical protein